MRCCPRALLASAVMNRSAFSLSPTTLVQLDASSMPVTSQEHQWSELVSNHMILLSVTSSKLDFRCA